MSFISNIASAQLCFKNETEYKKIIEEQQKMIPPLLQSIPIFLYTKSMTADVAIKIYFENGLIKFSGNVSTMIGDTRLVTTNENKINVCLKDSTVTIKPNVGESTEVIIVDSTKVKVKQSGRTVNLEVTDEKSFKKINAEISAAIDRKAKSKQDGATQNGGNQ
jgi:hypothetical protein